MLEFVRAGEKLIKEWFKGEQDPDVLGMAVEKIRQIGCPNEKLSKPFNRLYKASQHGFDSQEFCDRMEPFYKVFRSYRRRYLLEIRNQEMRNILELVHPLVAAQARSRGFDPDNPLMLSAKIAKLVDQADSEAMQELRIFKKLNDLWFRYFTRKKEGKPVKKTFRQIKSLRAQIKGYKTSRRES